jgi:hypothetical protein
VIPGVLVNLAMTMLAFLPMFIKRLLYDVQAKHQAKNSRSREFDSLHRSQISKDL